MLEPFEFQTECASGFSPAEVGLLLERIESGDGPGADGARSATAASGLPCLYRNNCNKSVAVETWNRLTSGHKKTAFKLAQNVRAMVEKYGINHVAAVCVTHENLVTDARESQKLWHSFATGYLSKDFEDWLKVMERCDSERIHYHILVALDEDVRTGFDFDAYNAARSEYRANGKTKLWRSLRGKWKVSRSDGHAKAYARIRKAVKAYGFGKVVDLMPVLSNETGVAFYFGKYISKHVEDRCEADKGVRLFACSKGVRRAGGAIAWNSRGSWLWRRKLRAVADELGFTCLDDFTRAFGSSWAFFLAERIMAFDLATLPGGITYPSKAHLLADGRKIPEGVTIDEETPVHVERVFPRVEVRKLRVRRYGLPWRPRVEILGDPVWAVPDYPPRADVDSSWITPEKLLELGAREREMRLYASAIPPWHDARKERRFNDDY